MRTTGRSIFVTGSGTGIGRALAHHLHDIGNTAIVAGRRPEALREAVGDRLRMSFVELDVADAASVAAAAQRVTAGHPDLDVLVSCAGISGEEDLTTKRDLGPAEQMVNTNLLGPMRLINALIDHLKSLSH